VGERIQIMKFLHTPVTSSLIGVFRNKYMFSRWEVVSPSPNRKVGGPPLDCCPWLFFLMPPHVLYGLRGLPSRLWPKCNRLLMLGRPWGAVTLSQWGGWWYMDMEYREGP
jgi:hypothetical protein